VPVDPHAVCVAQDRPEVEALLVVRPRSSALISAVRDIDRLRHRPPTVTAVVHERAQTSEMGLLNEAWAGNLTYSTSFDALVAPGPYSEHRPVPHERTEVHFVMGNWHAGEWLSLVAVVLALISILIAAATARWNKKAVPKRQQLVIQQSLFYFRRDGASSTMEVIWGTLDAFRTRLARLPPDKRRTNLVLLALFNIGDTDVGTRHFDDRRPYELEFTRPIELVHLDGSLRLNVQNRILEIGPDLVPAGSVIRIWLTVIPAENETFFTGERHAVELFQEQRPIIENTTIVFTSGLMNPKVVDRASKLATLFAAALLLLFITYIVADAFAPTGRTCTIMASGENDCNTPSSGPSVSHSP
jgi:hypothetical protein